MRAALGPILVVLAVVSGCTAPAPTTPGPASGEAVLALSAPVRMVGDFLAREAALEQLLDGTIFLAGYPGTFPDGPPVGFPPLDSPGRVFDFGTTPPGLWSSSDGGATWTLVDVGQPADGAVGNSDVDLTLAPDGTLYFVSMSFSSVGHSIAAGSSTDGGASWTWNLLSAQPGADRPWIEVAPDGTAHAVWNDGAIVHHASSADRGASWQEGPPVHVRGGDGSLAVSPEGALVVRIIPASGSGYTKHEGQDGVALSEDSGASWTFRALPGNRSYQAVPEFFTGEATDFYRWADPVGFDAAGTLYAAWGEEGTDTLVLARSADLGATWAVVPVVRTEDGGLPIFPHIRAHPLDAGVLAMTWFTRPAEGEILAHVALVAGADGPAPSLRRASFTPDTAGGTGGEYIQPAFLQDGRIALATPVQNGNETGFEVRTAR